MAIFEEICAVEEAASFHEWAVAHPDGEVDLTRCHHLHTAILQVLLAAHLAIIALPPNRFLASCVQHLVVKGVA